MDKLVRVPDDRARLANAVQVANTLESFLPGSLPERPEILTFDDGQIYAAHHKSTRGKVTKEERAQLRYFGLWRAAVERIEGQRASNLLLLLGCVEVLEAGDHYDLAREIRNFVQLRYKLTMPDKVWPSFAARKRWAERFAQDRTLFPLHLRLDIAPPIGKGTRPAEIDDHGSEDPHEPPF